MKIFFSYSHQDESALAGLRKHLAVLERELQLEFWWDQQMLAGSEIDPTISEKLESSHLILLLISPDFLASDYCTSREMKRALERHECNDARVVPIILEPCDWRYTSLGKLKALPKDGVAISNWENENDAFNDVVQELRRILTSGDVCSESCENSTEIAEDERLKEPPLKMDYRVKREFDDFDVSSFRDRAFGIIRDHFEQSVADIVKLATVNARFVVRSSTCFVCTVINMALTHGTAHITVHSGNENRALGDIYYSFNENASTSTANGGYLIQSDDYKLFLKPWMDMQNRDKKLTPETVGDELWTKFVEKAGILKT